MSKYFTLPEMTASAMAKVIGVKNTPDQEAVDNLNALMDNILDPLREAYGKPIIVNSGYRCPKLNKAVGGVANSQHLTGQAADIRGQSNKPEEIKKLYDLCKSLGLDVDQCLHEGTWLHVSYRKDGKNRRQFLKK